MSEIFDEGQESESTSEAQAAANRAAIAERRDRRIEHLEATLEHVHPDAVEGVQAQIAALRAGEEPTPADAEPDEEAQDE